MLIKVNSLIYKTNINVKIKLNIKITDVLITSIFLVSGKIEQETNKKAGCSNGLSSKFGPTMKRSPSDQLTPQYPDFRGNKSQLIHPNLSHSRTELCRQSLRD